MSTTEISAESVSAPTPPSPPTFSAAEFTAVRNSPKFQKLKFTHRRFAFSLTIASLAWYFTYLLLATFAGQWMIQPLWGMNVGLWLGLAQFVTTFAVTWLYVRFANKRLEPLAASIRDEMTSAH